MKKKKIAVIGASGRMGQEIAETLKFSEFAEAYLGIVKDKNKPPSGYKNISIGLKNLKIDFDVVIDFSSIEAIKQNLDFCVQNSIPVVSGLTGLQNKHFKLIQEASKKVPVLWAPNMSIGVATLVKAIESLQMVKDFDFQIEEIHHKMKKDSPSGTALFLQNKLEKSVLKQCPQPLSIRAGGIFGNHKVLAISENEMLSFEHIALNRKIFSEGAVKAAIWLSKKTKGLYSLQDMIG